MKKLSLLALPLALLALGSCNNNEEQYNYEPNELGFVPTTSFKSSRGYTTGATFEEVTYENLIKEAGSQGPEDRSMYISAYLTPQNGEGKIYFQQKFFKKLEEGESWCNHTVEEGPTFKHAPIYWPIGGTLDFLAVSSTKNFGLGSPLNWGANPAEELSFTVTKENCSQNDILYSGVYGQIASCASGNVPMTFKHAQAWLTFELTADTVSSDEPSPTDTIFYLEKIELEKAWSAGDLTIHRNGTMNEAIAEWKLSHTNLATVVVDNMGSRTVKGLNNKENQHKKLDMLIPQQQQCAFILYYTIAGDAPSVVHQYRFELPNTENWMMGQHYTYKIHLSANEITVTPTVTEWASMPFGGDDVNTLI